MISNVDIATFGSFSGFEWRKSVRDSGQNVKNFQRLNIIYGRNYSGKTTLSRVLRALETGKLPPNYTDASFTVTGKQGTVGSASLQDHDYHVRVYNRDFVAENLSFLVNQNVDGEIKTFAVVGEKNKEIDDAIAVIETKLGSVETQAGLRFDLEVKKKDRSSAAASHSAAANGLDQKLRLHAANQIKKNPLFGVPVYDINNIRRDIEATKIPGFTALTLQEQAAKLELLKQDALPDILTRVIIELNYDSLVRQAGPLLSKSITPTKPIQELLHDSILQQWVKEGIPHHRNKREVCAFCQQSLPHNIWQILDAHFNKESDGLEGELNRAIGAVTNEMAYVENLISLRNDQFYAEERAAFEIELEALNGELRLYRKDLEEIKTSLQVRKKAIFQPVDLPRKHHNSQEIQRYVDAINELISRNNDKTKTLELQKKGAREALRLANVGEFASAIGYDAEIKKIESLKAIVETAEAAYKATEEEIRETELEIQELRNKQSDERRGAELVNSLLNNFFGHDGLKLEPRDTLDRAGVKFEITRDGKPAYNLSEGECSLIAFCYFMAKLGEPYNKGKDLIIYIDDPISSLDSNHIFFIFSLIESLIAKPVKQADGSNAYRYKQLFISTHNLDFLKYLRRLSIPTQKIPAGEGKTRSVSDYECFMIERNGASSNLRLMPPYLKEYITEFHYLFHQIYKCKDELNAQDSHEPFYSFGNNLRKFLEVFLFYKYPYHDDKNDSLERIKKFFGEGEIAVTLINRLNNEFSHLEAVPDRGFKPVEIPEISRLANYVLERIFASDPTQYNALLKSIGEAERIS